MSATAQPNPRRTSAISPRVGWLLAAVVFVVSAAISLWWLHHFRSGFPLDTDESRYIAFAVGLKDHLADGSFSATGHLWAGQKDFGPLLPLVSVPVLAVFGNSLTAALATQLVFLAVLVAASYGLGTRLTTPAGGVLAAGVVAAAPGIVDFTRSYQFPVAATAMLAASTFALLASERMERRGWAIGWGVLLGATALARTMMLAFLPAQVVLAAWLALENRDRRRPRLINGLLGLVAAAITSLTWYAWSARAVGHYLTGFGYGESSAHFGSAGSRVSISYWTRELGDLIKTELYLPLAVLLLVALVLGVVAVAARRRGSDERWAATLRRWATSDVFVIAIVALEAYLAISSSHNEGVGFRVPLVPLLVVLGIWCVWQVPWRGAWAGLVAALIAVSLLNVVMKADVSDAVSRTRTVSLPTLGSSTVLNGTGYIQGYVNGSFEVVPRPAVDRFPAAEKGWLRSYDRIVTALANGRPRPNPDARIRLATLEPLLNLSNFTLANQLRFGQQLKIQPIVPPDGPQTQLSTARAILAPPAADGLITVDRTGLSYYGLTGHSTPKPALVNHVARRLGYRKVATVQLPDRRHAFVWLRRKR